MSESAACAEVETTDAKNETDWTRNIHLKSYLEYYETLERPRFAVLVTGEWGTGKTYLVEKLLPWEGDNQRAVYVSLFGLKSAEELVGAIYAEQHPSEDKLQKGIEKLGEAVKGASVLGVGIGGIGAGLANFVAAKMRKQVDPSKVIIFDDLERSDIAPLSLLGIINHFVEHHGCRIVVIAHDEKLVGGICEAKEKIFGQTIRVQPDFDSAYNSFILELKSDRPTIFINLYKDIIKTCFAESAIKSLRVLRQVIYDLARLYAVLEERHINHPNAMRELVALFSAFDFEVRAGRIAISDLEDRQGKTFRRSFARAADNNATPEAFLLAQDRYSAVNLESSLLKDDILIQTLLQGRYDAVAICDSINASQYFAKLEDLPSWRKVIDFELLDDQVVDEAAAAMQRQFDDRAILNASEMLHVFALRMMMANRGIISKTIDDVEIECIMYIDDLLASRTLSIPEDMYGTSRSQRFRGAHGISFWIEDEYNSAFHRVVSHFESQINAALTLTYSEEAEKLIDILISDVDQFIVSIAYSDHGGGKFARLPVLQMLKPKEFVAAWLSTPKQGHTWYRIKEALENRYSGNALHNIAGPAGGWLRPEAEWIRAVIEALKDRAGESNGFAKRRIERVIPNVKIPH
jgi:hypothetical protein